MQRAIDLPLRESTSPRDLGAAQIASVQMPSLAQWIKAGVGLGIGATIVFVANWFFWIFIVSPILLRSLLRTFR